MLNVQTTSTSSARSALTHLALLVQKKRPDLKAQLSELLGDGMVQSDRYYMDALLELEVMGWQEGFLALDTRIDRDDEGVWGIYPYNPVDEQEDAAVLEASA